MKIFTICTLMSFSLLSKGQGEIPVYSITDFPKYFQAVSVDYGVMEIMINSELADSPTTPSWLEKQTVFYAVQLMTDDEKEIKEVARQVLNEDEVELSKPVATFKNANYYYIVVYREKIKL